MKEKWSVKEKEFLVCKTKKINNFIYGKKYKISKIVNEKDIFLIDDNGDEVSFEYDYVKNIFNKLVYINYHDEQQKKEMLKEGDIVLIKPSFFNSFQNNCEDETEIPLHNHGKVLYVDKDHNWKYTVEYSKYYYVKIELPNKEVIELFNSDLIRLY